MEKRSVGLRIVRFKTFAIGTRYWRPGDDYEAAIVKAVRRIARDKDVVVISEKAISIAIGNIIDESRFSPGLMAHVITRIWIRTLWGLLLGRVCHLSLGLTRRLRTFPVREGSRHKEAALRVAGFLHALKPTSENGIDVTNLPYAFVSLPLSNPAEIAERIRTRIRDDLRMDVVVLISDTDKTYSWRGFHFSPRSQALKGIRTGGGFLTYVVGRAFKLRPRSTPLALVGSKASVETALLLAELAHRARGYGAGRTAWDMAERFGTKIDSVSWEMLDGISHYPIVVVRRIDHIRL